MRIYLDNCCLNRPFDDGGQVRIALEAEAVSAILKLCGAGDWTLISSDALEFEVDQAPAGPRKIWLEEVLLGAAEYLSMNVDIESRAADLEARRFKNIDAIHIATAEAAHADCFCTCDDRLLRLARKQVDLRTAHRFAAGDFAGAGSMIQKTQSLSEMSERAVRLLVRELGVVDTLRFLNQFRVGTGDYSKDRDAVFHGQSAAELAGQIKHWRAANPRSMPE